MEPSIPGGPGPSSGSSFRSGMMSQPSYQYAQMGDYNNPNLWVSTPDYLQHHRVPIVPPTPSMLPSQSMLEMQAQHQRMMTTMQRQMDEMRMLHQPPAIQHQPRIVQQTMPTVQHQQHQQSLSTYHPQSTTNSQVAMADGFNHEIRRVYQHTQTHIPRHVEQIHGASPNVSTVTGEPNRESTLRINTSQVNSSSTRPRPPRPERLERPSTPRGLPPRVHTIRNENSIFGTSSDAAPCHSAQKSEHVAVAPHQTTGATKYSTPE